MVPLLARSYIAAFELPDEEAAALIECDVKRRSYQQACKKLGMSQETLKRIRRRAFSHIQDAMEQKSPSG